MQTNRRRITRITRTITDQNHTILTLFLHFLRNRRKINYTLTRQKAVGTEVEKIQQPQIGNHQSLN